LEPDALASIDCLTATDQQTREADLSYAVNAFYNNTQASVYIDAGNPSWQPVDTMVNRLIQANVANAVGFAIDVSNFQWTADDANYGDQIVQALAAKGVTGKTYVIDTSRNGQGPAADNAWCNPPGRGLGKHPTTVTDMGLYSDAYLWVKTVGESDGSCHPGDPAAGQWFASYADMLIANAVY
jgi:endoglucanase